MGKYPVYIPYIRILAAAVFKYGAKRYSYLGGHKSSSVWEGVCSICGKSVATTPHKMVYGHYLQKRGEHIGNFCVSVAKLRKENPDFFASLEEKWSSLNSKRTFRFKDHAIAQKRMTMHNPLNQQTVGRWIPLTDVLLAARAACLE